MTPAKGTQHLLVPINSSTHAPASCGGRPSIDSREVRREYDGVADPDTPYYRRDLALVHHLGFGLHADECAPGILELLRPVRERDVGTRDA